MAMKVLHTSPISITNINAHGTFDDCLFFSANEYSMSITKDLYVYSLELKEDKIITVSNLYDAEIVAAIAAKFGIDEDQAEALLDGSDSAFDYSSDYEDDFWIQAKQGECAKKMGYEAAEAEDEQGTVYIVPMLGREAELKLEKVYGA